MHATVVTASYNNMSRKLHEKYLYVNVRNLVFYGADGYAVLERFLLMSANKNDLCLTLLFGSENYIYCVRSIAMYFRLEILPFYVQRSDKKLFALRVACRYGRFLF